MVLFILDDNTHAIVDANTDLISIYDVESLIIIWLDLTYLTDGDVCLHFLDNILPDLLLRFFRIFPVDFESEIRLVIIFMQGELILQERNIGKNIFRLWYCFLLTGYVNLIPND